MKGWGWLALLLGALLGTAWARRSQDLHCGGKGAEGDMEGAGWDGEGKSLGEDGSKAWEKDEWRPMG